MNLLSTDSGDSTDMNLFGSIILLLGLGTTHFNRKPPF